MSTQAILEEAAQTALASQKQPENGTQYDGWFYFSGPSGKPRQKVTVTYRGDHGKHYVECIGKLYTATWKSNRNGAPVFTLFEKDLIR